jgi:uncharacterized repeat protein (TIGR01451 family)
MIRSIVPVRRARRANPHPRRRRALAVVLAQVAAVLALVVALPGTAQAGPQPVMYGFIPLPANQFATALEQMRSGAGTTLDFTVGLTNAGGGAVLTYDHWEDGYETDLANPSQSTTLVFGDGNTGNGNAATYCAACTGDLLPQGAPLIMRNNIATPRSASPATMLFDGRDKVGSTRGFAITAGGFTTTRGSLQAAVVSAYDTSKYGTSFTVPVGTDTPVPSGASNPFSYAATFVQAAEDGTVVQVDSNADGVTDVSQTIGAGQVLHTTGLREGATVRTSAPAQVHLITGDTSAQYESRSFPLFPDAVLSDEYLSPAGSSVLNFATNNFLYNPTDAAITVTPTCTGCSGTITVPANASATYRSPVGRAVRFTSTGGVRFVALAGVGAHSGSESANASDTSLNWDWGFSMVPSSQLTTQIVLGWAPGNSNNPPSSPSGNRDDGPVWVTTTADTVLRVDFDGNPATGTIATEDCFGRHDLELTVSALASTRIHDSTDGDMTGARIYTCDETPVSAAWGEDPANAPVGSPGFDAGYTVLPSTSMVVDKSAAVALDADGDGSFSPGDTVTYEVSIADAGSLAFTDVVLTDVLQPGMDYVPGTAEIEDGDGTTPFADDAVPPAATPFPFDEAGAQLPTIEPGDTVIVRFDVTVDAPFLSTDGTLGNTACVEANEASGCDTVEIDLTEADLSLTKQLVGNPARVGDEGTFLITVRNDGPDDAGRVEVTDLLPEGTTYVSHDPSQGAYDPATGLWAVGALAADAEATLEVVATIDRTTVTNVAEITDASVYDPDSQPAEDPLDDENPPNQDDEDEVTVTVAPASIDLSLTKELTDVGTYVGDEATFEVTVTNDGPSVATGVVVADQLPAGLGFVSSTASQGAYDAGSGAWTVGTLPVGGSATLELVVTVDATGEITNTAQVSAAGQDDADSTPNNGDATEDDQDDAVVEVAPLIDLELTKELGTAPTYVGGDATFEISVTNRGPSDATGVVVTDRPGEGLSFVDSDDPAAFDGATGAWTVGDLAVGATATITVTYEVGQTASINLAEVSAADQDDVDSEPAENALALLSPPDQDDEDGASLQVAPLIDLSLAKETTVAPAIIGDEATFEITVTNDGPSDATGVVVTDQLPAGLGLVSHDATQGSWDPATGAWTVGDLAVDASATLTVVATVDALEVTNRAQVTAADQDDVDSQPAEGPLDDANPPDQDDEDEALVVVDAQIDLSLTKAATTTPQFVGDAVTYEVVVTNDGPSIATGVQVTDRLPAGLVLTSSATSQGSFDGLTGVWDVGTLAVGGTATLTIEADAVLAGTITNVAEVTAADQDDPDSTPDNQDPAEDDQGSAIVEVDELIDLSLAKELTTTPTYLGEVATYRLTVANAGPSTATGVVVTDQLPDGLTFVSSTAGLAYDAATGEWTVGTLEVGGSASVEIDVIVEALSTLNVAEVAAADQTDIDSQPAEGPLDAANPPDQDDEAVQPLDVEPLADLSLTKEQTGDPIHIGDEATFEITVANAGPSAATGVVVTDQLPDGLTFVSADASQGTYDEATGEWSVGTLDVDASATLTIVATVEGGTVVNRAQVTAVDQDDPDSQPGEDPLDEQTPPNQDDEDEATVEVDPLIDLALTKVATQVPDHVGDEVTYEVIVANAGPSTATGVVVDDDLPAGLTFVSADASQGTYDEASGAWTVGTLETDTSATLTVVATVTSPDEIVNVAEVAAADQDDVDSTPANDDPTEDDQDEAAIDVDPLVDVSLAKEVATAPTYLGDTATFLLTVRNDGPSPATGVEVTDQLPTGLRFVEASTDAYDAESGVWTVGTIEPGGSRQLEITVVVERLSATNRAEVTATVEEDVDSQPAENPFDGSNPADQDDEDAAPIAVAPLVDLSLTKSSSPAQVDQLDDATFTITVRNDGPSDATGVEVTDQLPEGVTFLAADASQGDYDPTTGIWTVGDLAVDGTATLDIDVEVTGAGPITNVAEVTATNEDDVDSTPGNGDPSEDDQDATVLTSDPVIDLSVTKAVDPGTANVGDEVTYTVTVTNDGPSAATGVVVEDQLPGGVAHVSHEASAGTWSPETGAWEVGGLEVGETATLVVVAELRAPGTTTNVAQVIDADQLDVDSQPAEDPLGPDAAPNQDDEAAAPVVGLQIDLELGIEADATVVGVGDVVTYTVTLTNQGPSDATGVAVDALLPPGVTFVSSNPAVGSYDPATGTWTVGPLAVGETTTLEIVVTIDQAGPITVEAQVDAADQPDVDSTPSNDEPTEDDQDDVVVTGELADLSLTKTVDEAEPALGAEVTYTLSLTNGGPSTATGVAVLDPLPVGLGYLGHDGPGSYDPATGRWEVGSLPAGETVELAITVRVEALGTTTNVAWVTESDQPDPDSTPSPGPGDPTEDDQSSVDVTPIPATLEGVVWLDTDGDGTFDDDESPIPGVTVVLLDADGEVVATTTTGDDGSYRFEDLFPGSYVVEVDETTLPETIAGQTYDPDDVVDGRFEVTLEPGDNVVDVDFGYRPTVDVTVPGEIPVEETTPPQEDAGLPVTGRDLGILVGIALALLAGGTLLLGGRRRPAPVRR